MKSYFKRLKRELVILGEGCPFLFINLLAVAFGIAFGAIVFAGYLR